MGAPGNDEDDDDAKDAADADERDPSVAAAPDPVSPGGDPPPLMVALEWPEPGSSERPCIDRDALQEAVEQRLERPVFVAGEHADLIIKGSIEAMSPSGWSVVLTSARPDGAVIGSRELTTQDAECRNLDDSIALVIALVVEAPRTRSKLQIPAKPKPAPVQTPPSAPPSPPKADAARAPATRPRAATPDPWRARIGAGGALSSGLLPGVAFGGRLDTLVEPPGFVPLAAMISLWAPTRVDDGTVGLEVGAWLAAFGACPTLVEGRAGAVALCGFFEAGPVRAAPVGLISTNEPTRGHADVLAEARAQIELGRRASAEIAAGAGVPISRNRFTYTAIDGREVELHEAASIRGSAAIGLKLKIP